MNLREYVPLKQGLRQKASPSKTPCTPRVCSTKTRIKTSRSNTVGVVALPPRVCSTKTRIKTILTVTHSSPSTSPPRVCSTKTRIKTLVCSWEDIKVFTPRVCSTKTRIKTTCLCTIGEEELALREYVPLKQGLRPRFKSLYLPGPIRTLRVCSTKTWIQTYSFVMLCMARVSKDVSLY